MQPHEHYEELCAVAATGQASEIELEELKDHLQACPGCRQLVGDFAQIAAQAVPEVADKHVPTRVPGGMKERFVARAYSEGVYLHKEPAPSVPNWLTLTTLARWGAVAASAVILAVAVKVATARYGTASHSVGSGSPIQVSAAANSGAARAGDAKLPANDELKQPAAEKAERDSLARKLEAAQKSLESQEVEKGGMRKRLAELEEANFDLQKKQAEGDTQIAQLKEDLGKLQSEHEADRIASMVQETELNSLRNKVTSQGAELTDHRRLTVAANQARDLIVARNLHIVDVHDMDEEGRGQKAFGRIFYTEGKSLVFYAYDLADPRQLNAKISFYVWGEKLGATQPVKNLGIFHSDDASDGRWVLTFDDSQVLARINSVFVTVESSKKTINQPSGKKILYAYLGSKANHP